MTAPEVADLLLNHDSDEPGTWNYWDHEASEVTTVAGLGTVRVVDNVGGMGQGNHAHLVFKIEFEGGGVGWYKIDGYYSSYDGTDWDGDLYQVTPRQNTVTVYE